MTSHIERTKEMIAVMQAYVDGRDIEVRRKVGDYAWVNCEDMAGWNWLEFVYRVRETPDQIEWSHVSPNLKWMARDDASFTHLFEEEPKIREGFHHWYASGAVESTAVLSSYKRGTVSWDKSLVKRPEGV